MKLRKSILHFSLLIATTYISHVLHIILHLLSITLSLILTQISLLSSSLHTPILCFSILSHPDLWFLTWYQSNKILRTYKDSAKHFQFKSLFKNSVSFHPCILWSKALPWGKRLIRTQDKGGPQSLELKKASPKSSFDVQSLTNQWEHSIVH